MLMLKYLALFICNLAFGAELVVTLQTEQLLCPIYVAKMESHSEFFNAAYASSLSKTLLFDLRCGGYSRLIEERTESEKLAHKKNPEEAFPLEYWKSRGAQYVIVPEIQQNKLSIKIFDVKNSSLRELLPIELNGNLENDDLIIHKISDLLHKTLYNVKGIAQKRILFAMQKENKETWISEIWECRANGKDLKQLTFENNYSISPILIPASFCQNTSLIFNQNDYKFLYVCYKHGQPKIYLSQNGEKKGTPMISLRGNQILPAISRKFDKIAFISDASGRADLFLQMFDPKTGPINKPIQIFSEAGTVQASPSFSPDGTKIAFVSDKSSTPRVYIIDLLSVLRDRKSTELQCITTINRENTSPSWSPDGKKIVYSAKSNGVRQIWLYDVEKREEIQLTSGQADKENPCFADDSLHIVYNTTSPSFDIFLLDLNQLEPVQITDGPGKKHYPCWEP
jgi:TolB protein